MIGICAAAPAIAAAQADFSVDVKVVNLVATVRDKSGRLITQLKRDDFAVEEDGHPQPITYFGGSNKNDLPLTLGLLVDTSGSQKQVLGHERTASVVFFNEVLRDIDRAYIAKFDAELKMYRELTPPARSCRKDSVRSLQRSAKAAAHGDPASMPCSNPPML